MGIFVSVGFDNTFSDNDFFIDRIVGKYLLCDKNPHENNRLPSA